MDLQGTSFIGAGRGSGGAGESRAVNPVSGEEMEPAYLAEGEESVEAVCSLAAAAFVDFRERSGVEKAGFLRAIADEVDALEEEIVSRMTRETGLPEGRCRMEKGLSLIHI